MKTLGIVRDIDKLGRFVIPVELRNKLGIENGDPLEIFTEDDKIILKRYEKACVFCSEERNVIEFNDRVICRNCLAQIKEL